MEANNRQKQILRQLDRDGRVRVSELAKNLYFSEMTIRRDLKVMEKEGLLRRVHGGAVSNDSDFQYPVAYRMEINKERKQMLASLATRYLKDGQVIFFNSSSTLTYLLPYLANYKNLRVVTNSVHLLQYAAKLHIPCSLTGGRYNEIEQCLSGRESEAYLAGIYPDLAFLSCEALSDDGRVTDSDGALAEIARIAVKNAGQTVLLMDRSKLGAVCTYHICRTDELTDVILL